MRRWDPPMGLDMAVRLVLSRSPLKGLPPLEGSGAKRFHSSGSCLALEAEAVVSRAERFPPVESGGKKPTYFLRLEAPVSPPCFPLEARAASFGNRRPADFHSGSGTLPHFCLLPPNISDVLRRTPRGHWALEGKEVFDRVRGDGGRRLGRFSGQGPDLPGVDSEPNLNDLREATVARGACTEIGFELALKGADCLYGAKRRSSRFGFLE